METQSLFKYYDESQDGTIAYEGFIRGLREPLSDRRLQVVSKAFNQLDQEGSGKITVADAYQVFSAAASREFQQGVKSHQQVADEFFANFEGTSISRVDFIDYYADLSFTITDDDSFISLVENTWGIAEDEEASVFRQQVQNLVSAIRMKLRVIANQSGEEYILLSIFKDFDTSKTGQLTIEELGGMLNKLQISCERKFVSAIFKRFDVHSKGVIEFEEFKNYIINDPYK